MYVGSEGSANRIYVESFDTEIMQMDGGQSIEYLKELQDEIMTVEKPFTKIGETLGEMIENPHKYTSDQDTLATLGRFLIGQTLPNTNNQIDRIFYAEGEGMRQSGAFSMVRVAIWDKTRGNDNSPYMQSLRNPAFQKLIQWGLKDIHQPDAYYAGAPVERTTRVLPLYPAPRENLAGYIYGHQQDEQALGCLSVPFELKSQLLDTMKQYHRAELYDQLIVDIKN